MSNSLLEIIMYIEFNKDNLSSFELLVQAYCNSKIFKINIYEMVLINNRQNVELYVKNGNSWNIAEVEDEKDFKQYINKTFDISRLNSVIGFIDCIYSISEYNYTFKTIDLKLLHNSGARCNNVLKNTIINQIKDIILSAKYNDLIDEDVFSKYRTLKLCLFQEIILRYLNKENVNNNIWFMCYEETQIYRLKSIKYIDDEYKYKL